MFSAPDQGQAPELPDDPLERAIVLKEILVSLATGGGLNEDQYLELRSDLMATTSTKKLLPKYIRRCRSEGELWDHFKGVWSGHGAYAKRREHISTTLEPLLEFLEELRSVPADADISGTLLEFDSHGVHRVWERALERRHEDPEGAITISKTLLEAVCKRILDEKEEKYGKTDDLPKLYHKTASSLNLAPSQHEEEVFRKILGNCQQVVNNLGTIRNQIGDAHAKGGKPVRPHPRHAALAVNLAGAMATFLVETFQATTDL